VELALGLALVLEAGNGKRGAGKDGKDGDGDDEFDQGEAALSIGDSPGWRREFQFAFPQGLKPLISVAAFRMSGLKP
jgi:hypothetical protein